MKKEKLIRDKVPELARANGDKLVVEKIENGEEFVALLKEKLVEEAVELREAGGERVVEELVDVVEVARALVGFRGLDWSDIERLRKKKLKKAGGFEKRLKLVGRVESDIKKAKSD